MSLLQEHNANPEAKRLHAKDKLKAAQDVVQVVTKGERITAPKKQFVTKDAHLRDFPGEEIKDDIVTKFINNQLVEGVYSPLIS